MSNKIPKPIECPNCGSSNTCYNVPDWEDGYCNDSGFFECFNCGYNTGPHQTEEGIMAVIKSYPAPWTTEAPTEEGWYWFKSDYVKLECIKILYDRDCRLFTIINNEKWYISMLGGNPRFKGPLRPEE